jgi:acetyl esterase
MTQFGNFNMELDTIRIVMQSNRVFTALLAVTFGLFPGLMKALDKNGVEFARPNDRPLLLDLHVPEGKGAFPAAILVHGGGFDMGNRRMYIVPTFDVLSKAGFAWFSIDYRLAPEGNFPENAHDLEAAIRWVRQHAGEYHVNKSKIALIGESAGAYLVDYAGTHETPQTKVAAVVSFYGPSDMLALNELRRDHPEMFDQAAALRHPNGGMKVFGVAQLDEAGASKMRQISPINAVHRGEPPFLLIHGNKDEQVAYSQSPAFCEAIRKVGAQCDLVTIEGGRHGMGNWKEPNQQHWKTDMVAWLKKTMKVK